VGEFWGRIVRLLFSKEPLIYQILIWITLSLYQKSKVFVQKFWSQRITAPYVWEWEYPKFFLQVRSANKPTDYAGGGKYSHDIKWLKPNFKERWEGTPEGGNSKIDTDSVEKEY
jgi:hypothetical protein